MATLSPPAQCMNHSSALLSLQARSEAASAQQCQLTEAAASAQQLSSMQQQLAKANDARSEAERRLAEVEAALASQQRLVDVLREQCDREAGGAQRALALEARVQVRTLCMETVAQFEKSLHASLTALQVGVQYSLTLTGYRGTKGANTLLVKR
jgi:chromosome segregation ATPase